MDKKKKDLALWCRDRALQLGADHASVRLVSSHDLTLEWRDGKVQRSTSEDSGSLIITLYKNDRVSYLRSGRLDSRRALSALIRRNLAFCAELEADPDQTLPPKASKYKGKGVNGDYDERCGDFSREDLMHLAQDECRYGQLRRAAARKGVRLISEVVTVSCSSFESYFCDSDGFEGEKRLSGWMVESEVNIRDGRGAIYAQYDYEYATRLKRLRLGRCSRRAFQKCLERIGAAPCEAFTGVMVVQAGKTGRLINPLLNALKADSVRRDQSFLSHRLGEQVFSSHFTLTDCPHRRFHHSRQYFDSEGVATHRHILIDRGVIRAFYASTALARKTGLPATVSEAASLTVRPYLHCQKKKVNLPDILSGIRDGIYVTDWNGGNSNALTGDFSFGIEGRRIRDGKLAEPVSGMVVTGNLISLFRAFRAAGSDAAGKTTDAIGTLAFDKVTFNA